jgi:hypothetical protein
MSTDTQGMSEDDMTWYEQHHFGTFNETVQCLVRECRRLQQRERDLQTAARMWEDNYNTAADYIKRCVV